MVEVRSFVEADRPRLLDLAVAAGAGSPSGSLWGDPDSEADIYLWPYVDREPDSFLVAEVDGELVGYLAGCADTATFPSEESRIEAATRRHRLFRRRETRRFFARALRDTVAARLRRQPTAGELNDPRWPAHLHIDVVPAVRGTGVAGALMDAWLTRLDTLGVPGCYLQTLVENPRAVRFFTRAGFVEHGEAPVVPGLRHEGARVHQRTMVRPAG